MGVWAPSFARTINAHGSHLHLLSDDFAHGGPLLELQTDALTVDLHNEDHIHLALPDIPAFLAADLCGDPSASLAQAEGAHH